jgi:hypothetical protein
MEQEIFLLKMLGYAVPKIYLDIFKKAVFSDTLKNLLASFGLTYIYLFLYLILCFICF